MTRAFEADVIVAGGGPAGLTAAALMVHNGLAVELLAPPAPPDNRTTALMQGSLDILQRIGVWPRLAPHTGALKRLRIVDASDNLVRAPEVTFEASEIGLNAFGHNIENTRLCVALLEAAQTPHLSHRTSRAIAVVPEEDAVRVTLDEGVQIAAPLLAAADGRNSLCRRSAGISVRTHDYPQAAMTLNIAHSRPHEDTSTEFHFRGGPFTLVPLPGQRSSVVLVGPPDEIAALAALDIVSLGRELERRSHGLLGRIEPENVPVTRPLGRLVATKFGSRRTALVGEAAHVLPPIGAQGLNLGIRDAAAIADLAAAGRSRDGDAGSEAVIAAYDRERRADVLPRAASVELLNRSLLTGMLPVQAGRAAGLFALARIAPLRRAVMRQGLGYTARS